MSGLRKKHHPALKHAAFSATTILPGESASEFEKLRRDAIAELNPDGLLENEIVETIAHLQWRRQNLATFRIAEIARARRNKIWNERVPNEMTMLTGFQTVDPDVLDAARRAAESQARKELGEAYELVEMGEMATIDGLMKDLVVQDRLDSMIDKAFRRLLFLRGLKSISRNTESPTPKKRLPPPEKGE